MTEQECYYKIYGELICFVPHYIARAVVSEEFFNGAYRSFETL